MILSLSLSVFLFLVVVEGLKCILDKAKDVGLLQSIHIGNLGTKLSLLQFADDKLIILPVDIGLLYNLKHMLRCFEVVCRLKINFKNSSLVGINVDEFFLCNASYILDYKVDKFPIKYLRLPLSNRSLKAKDWQSVLNGI